MAISTSIAMAAGVEHWAVSKLQPYTRNARTHSDGQIDKIAASIVEFGFTQPILIDGAAGVIAGHGRLRAALKLGMDAVPVIVLTHLSESQKRAYIIADNRLALDAGWDEELLADELQELAAAGYDTALTGFDSEELDGYLAQTAEEGTSADPDAAPRPEPDRCVTQLGDVWILGDHRLVCGDSRSVDVLELLMSGETADCLWTDPPYNVAYEGGSRAAAENKQRAQICNDEMSPEEFLEFLTAAFSAAYSALRPGGSAYVCYADRATEAVYRAFEAAGFHFSGNLIWRKNMLVIGRTDYHYMHEPIIYGWRGDGTHEWFGARDKTTVVEFAEAGLQQTGDDEWQLPQGETTLIIRGTNITVSRAHGSVFFEEKPWRSAEHPTMKPAALIERMLMNSTSRGQRVLDTFGGSGSTLIACQRLGRRARLVELDPKYCDVTVRRFQEFSGRAATLARSRETFAQRERALKLPKGGGHGVSSSKRRAKKATSARRR